MATSRRGWLIKLLAVVAAVVVAAALAEVALRVFGIATESVPILFPNPEPLSPDTVRDPDVFWLMRARGGADPVTPNGFRGEEFTPARAPGDLRVLCVGDSCTYGWSVRLPEAYGMVLDRRMQARFPARCVETVLAAAPGWSTYQDLMLVRRHAAALAADVMVLFVGVWNDMLPAAPFRDSAWAPEIERMERHPFWSLRIGRLLWRSVHPMPTAVEMKARFEAARTTGALFQRRVDLDEMQKNIRELVGWGRAHGPAVAVIPSTKIAVIGPWSADYRRAMLAIYRELGVPCVDSDAAFQAYVERHPDYRMSVADCISEDQIHPTAAGHAAIAEALEPVVAGLVAARGEGSAAPAATVASAEPATLLAGHAARVVLRGAGFAGASGPRRIFVHELSAPFRVVDDSTIEIDLAPDLACRPGPLAITLRTRAGVVTVAKPPVVLPWAPVVSLSEASGKRALRLSLDTTMAIAAVAWISTERFTEPAEGGQTRWGAFLLKDPHGAHPPGAFEDRMGFPGIGLPRIDFLRIKPAGAPASAETPVPEGFVIPASPLYAQVLIRFGLMPEDAWLSGVLPVVR